jgi:hypothetical protein
VAVKALVAKNEEDKMRIEKEIAIFKELQTNPGIVTVYSCH